MKSQDRYALASALNREYSMEGGSCDPDKQKGLERLVGAGAGRLGLRADLHATDPIAVNACLLAPPLARLIDHTVLKPETNEDDIRSLCAEAREHCFASVCVSPVWVPLAARELVGATSLVCTVIGFPHGAQRTPVKAFETEIAVRDGASEIDMVIGIGRLKSRKYDDVEDDINSVVKAAQGRTVKVILETALLTDEEKVIACILAQNAGADFVKTSTGFASHGAKPADVALMRRVVGDQMGVKASGGIRSAEDAATMVEHGATRLGASAGVAILKGLTSEASY
ncbi:MAG: deoxyribose-phosphate aldolase [Rubricoccaceae bacterium]|nr:deoxyribose-phosphate aldolase [Rubricoccaceae bacterium]